MAIRTKSKPAKKPANGRQKKPAAKRKAASQSPKAAASTRRGVASVKGVVRAISGGKGRNGGKAKRANGGSSLPAPSTKPWGQAGKALDGVRILDFTHVQ